MDDGAPRRSGCVVAVYVLFGIGLFVLLAGAAAVYFVLQSPEGKQMLQAMGGGVEWIVEAAQAPGTDELREAGCDTALVTTPGRAAEVILSFVPEEQRGEAEQEIGGGDKAALQDMVIVVCGMGRFDGSSPSCSDVALIYGNAVEETPSSLLIRVQRQGANEPHCQGIYEPNGTLLENVDDSALKDLF